MRKLFITLILVLFLFGFDKVKLYLPSGDEVEKYQIGNLMIFIVPEAIYTRAKNYYNLVQDDGIGAFTVHFTNDDVVELQILYIPKLESGKIDIFILGHEMAHVLEYRKKDRTDLDNPDNCPKCRYWIHFELFKEINDLMIGGKTW